jgi:hypothetical protein
VLPFEPDFGASATTTTPTSTSIATRLARLAQIATRGFASTLTRRTPSPNRRRPLNLQKRCRCGERAGTFLAHYVDTVDHAVLETGLVIGA